MVYNKGYQETDKVEINEKIFDNIRRSNVLSGGVSCHYEGKRSGVDKLFRL